VTGDWIQRRRIAIWAAIGISVIYGVGVRLSAMGPSPLWLDESWTAAAWRSPNLQALLHYLYVDANAPIYSLFIWLWPGQTNLLLRLPTLLFAIAGAALAATARLPGTSLKTSAMWGATLLLWTPGLVLFSEARCYGLLAFFSVLQTVSFVRLIDSPERKQAIRWTAFAVLSCLTHYHAGLLAIVQGATLVATHRNRVLRLWPAVVLVVPLLAWGIYHLPRLREYAARDIAWYKLIGWDELRQFLFWPVAEAGISLLVLMVVLLFWRRPVSRSIGLTALSALCCLGLYILIGAFRPMMAERYLLPVVPPILLGLVTAVRPQGYIGLAAAWLIAIPTPARFREYYETKAWFGLQKPARYLPNTTRVSWYVDYGGSSILDAAQRDPLLVDAFERNGRTVEPAYGIGPDALIFLFKLENEAQADAIARSRECKRHYVVIWEWGTLICGPIQLPVRRPVS